MNLVFSLFFLGRIWDDSPRAAIGLVLGWILMLASFITLMDAKTPLNPWFPLFALIVVSTSFGVAFAAVYGIATLWQKRSHPRPKAKNAPLTVQSLREKLAHRPFKPLRLTLFNRQTFEIRHPNMFMLTRTSLIVGVNMTCEGTPSDFNVVPFFHITSMEPLGRQAA